MRSAARLLVAVAVLLAAGLANDPVHAERSPSAVVERLHTALLEVMREAASLDIQARYDRLAPTLDAAFDFRTMSQLAAGSAWPAAEPGERERLVDAFTRLSTATYAERFNGYSGERFETLGTRDGPRDAVLVDTRLVRPDDAPIPLTYVLHERADGWRIIDVIVQGSISELAVRRSEYTQILRNGDMGRLTDVLNRKAAATLQGQAG